MVAAYVFSVIAVILKPTVMLFAIIGAKIYKESKNKNRVEVIGPGERVVDKLTTQ